MDLISPSDVLGISWSRSLNGLAAALTTLPPCPIVQLTGAVPPPDDRDLLEVVRSVARIGGGPAHIFYAPMIVDSAQTAAAIRRQPDVADAFTMVPSVTMAIVAIGAWQPGLSTIYDAITPGERQTIADLGICGEVAGVFLDRDGLPRADGTGQPDDRDAGAHAGPDSLHSGRGLRHRPGTRGPDRAPGQADQGAGHSRQPGPGPPRPGVTAPWPPGLADELLATKGLAVGFEGGQGVVVGHVLAKAL